MKLTINTLMAVAFGALTVNSSHADGSYIAVESPNFIMASTTHVDPNNSQAETLKRINEAFAASGITESVLSEANKGNASKQGMAILKEMGLTDVPLVVISKPDAASPQVAWSIAWTSARGFHYTTEY